MGRVLGGSQQVGNGPPGLRCVAVVIGQGLGALFRPQKSLVLQKMGHLLVERAPIPMQQGAVDGLLDEGVPEGVAALRLKGAMDIPGMG